MWLSCQIEFEAQSISCLRYFLIYDRSHPRCECAPGYTGPHCEYVTTGDDPPASIEPEMTQKATISQKDIAAVISLSAFLAGLLVLVALLTKRQLRRIRRRKAEQMASINLQGFRDGGEDHNDEFAAVLPFRVAIDRFTQIF